MANFELNRAGRTGVIQYPTSSKGVNYIFAISIDKYLHLSPLNNAISDVESFINVLTDKYEFDIACVEKLYNEQATKSKIIRLFEEYSKKLTATDSLIIYHSGHGTVNNNKFGFWAPYEAEEENSSTYIPNSTIKDCINQFEALHILLISDSCFSGSFFRNYRGSQNSINNRKSRWAITSGQDNEFVLDGEKTSPFAEALHNFLLENDKESLFTSEIVAYVKVAVQNNFEQTPLGGVIFGAGDDAGEFCFKLKETHIDAWHKALSINKIDGYNNFINKYSNSEKLDEAKEKIQQLERCRSEWKSWLVLNIAKLEKIQLDFKDENYSVEINEFYSKLVSYLSDLEKEEKEEECWGIAIQSEKYEDYASYMNNYPSGKYINTANSKIKLLIKQKEDEELWEIVKEKADKSRNSRDKLMAYSMYLLKHPYGKHAERAKKIFDEIQEFIKAEKENNIKSYQNYLDKFHRPIFEPRAKRLIKQLEQEDTFNYILDTKSFTELEKLLKSADEDSLIQKIKVHQENLLAIEEREYLSAVQQNVPNIYYEFLEEYFDGPNAEKIRKIVNQMEYEAFKKADDSNDVDTLEDFAIKFSRGTYVNDALNKIEQIKNKISQPKLATNTEPNEEDFKPLNNSTKNFGKHDLFGGETQNENGISKTELTQIEPSLYILPPENELDKLQEIGQQGVDTASLNQTKEQENLDPSLIANDLKNANLKYIINSTSLEFLRKYINDNPNGVLKELVESKISALTKERRATKTSAIILIVTVLLLLISTSILLITWYY